MTEQTYAQELAELQSETLDSLLCQWHQWAESERGVRGYASRALVCGEYRSSRQYDDVSGALDDELDRVTMKAIDFNVREMAEPYRTGIYCLAKALVTGVAVFRSPRLPESDQARRMVVAQARNILTARLISSGVL